MLIIESHAHIGRDRIFDIEQTPGQLIEAMDKYGIETAIVQPFPGCDDLPGLHDRIAEMAEKHPGRIYGMASLSPHMDREAYYAEMQRCVEELHFVGIKCHTYAHAIMPYTADWNTVYETAHELGVPVMVHTGSGLPACSPTVTISIAQKYPDLEIVLAHTGFAIQTFDALAVAEVFDNIYLETSWTPVGYLRRAINVIGVNKIMFGADTILNLPVELTRYRALGLSETQLQRCFSETAREVFDLP